MLHELKLLARSLVRSPVLSATIVILIAVTIGANTAIFSVLEALLLRPLPLHEPERLVRLYESFTTAGSSEERILAVSETTLKQWRASNTVFSGIGGATGGSLTLTGRGDPQYVPVARITADLLPVLGVKPVLGRTFSEEEDRPGGGRVVIVSQHFWQQTLRGRADVLGQVLILDGEPFTVVGVMAAGFNHPYRAEVWVPLAATFNPGAPRTNYLYAPARLKPGVTLEQARQAMRELCTRLQQAEPLPANPQGASLRTLHEGFVSDLRPKLLLVATTALFVLLIAAANVASLLLARQIERQAETTLRSALGASRGRIIREYLWQSLMLATAGCAAGLLLAVWGTPVLYNLSPMADRGFGFGGFALNEFNTQVTVDYPVMLAAAAITLLLGFGAGLIPALRTSRQVELRSALQGNTRSVTLDRSARRLLGTLVMGEIAVALVLLVATSLMARSFGRLVTRPWGLAVENRAAFNVGFSERVRPEHAQRVDYAERAVERLRALPGVTAVTATNSHPLDPNLAAITPEGSQPPVSPGFFTTRFRLVFPGYFQEMKIPLLRGRAIDRTDRANGALVAVISESLANRFWPGQDPLGKRIKRGRFDGTRPWIEIIGVVADTRVIDNGNFNEVIGHWYLPYTQHPNYVTDNLNITLEASVNPESLQPAVRAALTQIDAGIAPYEFYNYERTIGETYLQDRFALLLVSLFGAIGLLLAVLGLYGLLTFQLALRAREFGVRAALGAQRADLAGLVFRQASGLLIVGLLVGIVISLALARLSGSVLPGATTADPLVFLVAAGLLSVTAALACWLPARRAAKVDPMVALRSE